MRPASSFLFIQLSNSRVKSVDYTQDKTKQMFCDYLLKSTFQEKSEKFS